MTLWRSGLGERGSRKTARPRHLRPFIFYTYQSGTDLASQEIFPMIKFPGDSLNFSAYWWSENTWVAPGRFFLRAILSRESSSERTFTRILGRFWVCHVQSPMKTHSLENPEGTFCWNTRSYGRILILWLLLLGVYLVPALSISPMKAEIPISPTLSPNMRSIHASEGLILFWLIPYP